MFKFYDVTKTIVLVSIMLYLAPFTISYLQHQWSFMLESHNKIGQLHITGSIDHAGYYRKNLNRYFKNPSIKAILLVIESDGGAAGSCQALAFDIEQLKKEYPKPIVTYTENICCAGAYQIAAATDYIVATGTAIIGNIGSTNTADKLHVIACTTEEQKAMVQSVTDNSYLQLAKDIAHKRHLQMNKLDQWGGNKILNGQLAYDLKLVDAIGSKTTAINLIKKNIIPSDRKIEWVMPEQSSLLTSLLPERHHEDSDILTPNTSWLVTILNNFLLRPH